MAKDKKVETTIPVNPQTEEIKAQQVEDQKMRELAAKAETGANIGDSQRENLLGWKRRNQIEILNKEPKVKILIPFTAGEDENNKANQYAFFGINGVWIQVRKGDYVDVPESVATLHFESLRRPSPMQSKASENATRNIGLKIDPLTGQKKTIEGLQG